MEVGGPRRLVINPGTAPHLKVPGAYLDLFLEQVCGQAFEGDIGPDGQPCPLFQHGDPAGVSGPVFRVEVLQGLEVVVDGVSYHNLVFQDLQDLEASERVRQAVQQKKHQLSINQIILC